MDFTDANDLREARNGAVFGSTEGSRTAALDLQSPLIIYESALSQTVGIKISGHGSLMPSGTEMKVAATWI